MTGSDRSSRTINRLIETCCETHEAFRSAADAADSDVLKTLFLLYAQQRNRFAEELRSFASVAPDFWSGSKLESALPSSGDADLVRRCLKQEKVALSLYREALAERALPNKAHFLVSAQLALLEKVHNRIAALAPREPVIAANRQVTA